MPVPFLQNRYNFARGPRISTRDFEQQLPFAGSSLLGFRRELFGPGAQFTRRDRVAGRRLDWVIGDAIDRQIDDRFRFTPSGLRPTRR